MLIQFVVWFLCGTVTWLYMNIHLCKFADEIYLQAITGSTSSKETSDSSEVKEEKSEIYSTNMTEAMGAGNLTHTML